MGTESDGQLGTALGCVEVREGLKRQENRLPPRRSLQLVTVFPVNAQTEPTAQCPEEERRPTDKVSDSSDMRRKIEKKKKEYFKQRQQLTGCGIELFLLSQVLARASKVKSMCAEKM
ncbi:hypothetical protein CapIbe_009648 [Capra ibex]